MDSLVEKLIEAVALLDEAEVETMDRWLYFPHDGGWYNFQDGEWVKVDTTETTALLSED